MANASYTCSYCGATMPITRDTTSVFYPSFDTSNFHPQPGRSTPAEELELCFYRCPKCSEISIELEGRGEKTKGTYIPVKPRSFAKLFPEYVPLQIRQDYEEAYSIVSLSPKASATLSRRCLQGMIHDYWNIHEKNLNAEITALQDKISPTLWKVLDGIRRIGNIGAHMEKDVNLIVDIFPDEAQKLLKVIEILVNDWYVQKHEQEVLFSEVIGIDSEKQDIKNSPVK